MNKELISITGGVLGGALGNGIKNTLPSTTNPMLINGAMALASGFASTKVDAYDTKSQFLKSALIGVAVVSGIALVRNLSEKAGLSAKLENPTKVNAFFKGFTGLNAPDNLNGVENGVYGYDFSNENEMLMGYEEDAGLYAYDDEDEQLAGYEEDEAQLLGYEDEAGLYAYDDEDEQLAGYEDEAGLYAYDDEDEQLAGYEEEAGLYATQTNQEKEFIF